MQRQHRRHPAGRRTARRPPSRAAPATCGSARATPTAPVASAEPLAPRRAPRRRPRGRAARRAARTPPRRRRRPPRLRAPPVSTSTRFAAPGASPGWTKPALVSPVSTESASSRLTGSCPSRASRTPPSRPPTRLPVSDAAGSCAPVGSSWEVSSRSWSARAGSPTASVSSTWPVTVPPAWPISPATASRSCGVGAGDDQRDRLARQQPAHGGRPHPGGELVGRPLLRGQRVPLGGQPGHLRAQVVALGRRRPRAPGPRPRSTRARRRRPARGTPRRSTPRGSAARSPDTAPDQLDRHGHALLHPRQHPVARRATPAARRPPPPRPRRAGAATSQPEIRLRCSAATTRPSTTRPPVCRRVRKVEALLPERPRSRNSPIVADSPTVMIIDAPWWWASSSARSSGFAELGNVTAPAPRSCTRCRPGAWPSVNAGTTTSAPQVSASSDTSAGLPTMRSGRWPAASSASAPAPTPISRGRCSRMNRRSRPRSATWS